MRVTNINGAGDGACKCGTWLEHWRRFSKQSLPICCPEKNCRQAPSVGAHVQRDGSIDGNWYIIPLCNVHGVGTGNPIEINDDVVLVPANAAETCG